MAKHKDKEGDETETESFPLVPSEHDPSLKRPEKVPRLDSRGYPVGEFDTTPTDLHEYEGKYRLKGHTEPFGLKVVDDPHGHTHRAKNKEFSWSGSAEQFKQEFEKL